jgi:hypothetical protein
MYTFVEVGYLGSSSSGFFLCVHAPLLVIVAVCLIQHATEREREREIERESNAQAHTHSHTLTHTHTHTNAHTHTQMCLKEHNHSAPGDVVCQALVSSISM